MKVTEILNNVCNLKMGSARGDHKKGEMVDSRSEGNVRNPNFEFLRARPTEPKVS
jgi:hypothetical protein